MNPHVKKFLKPLLKYFQDIRNVEILKHEEYTRGCTETAIQFSDHAKKQNEYINRLIAENLTKLEDLEKKNLKHEDNLREEYTKRINELEFRHSESCAACKKVTDEERRRINRLQAALAEKLNQVDEIFRRLYNRATMIAEEHGAIMQSTARAISSKNELENIQKEMNELTQETKKYLSTELIGETKVDLNSEETQENKDKVQNVQQKVEQKEETKAGTEEKKKEK